MQWSFAEDLVFYSKCGIERIGICRAKAGEFGIEKCREVLADEQVVPSSYGCATFFSDINGPSLAEQIGQTRRDIEDAATVGAECLVVHTGGPRRHLRKNRFCAAKKSIDQLLPIAEEYGVSLALEPLAVDPVCQTRFSHSLSDCVELIDSYQNEFLGLNLDLFHSGNSFLELDPGWFSKNVRLIQLSDFCRQGQQWVRCAMGKGELRLREFCNFVDSTRYDGVFEFETHGEWFDFVSYRETIASLAENFSVIQEGPSVEFESMKA